MTTGFDYLILFCICCLAMPCGGGTTPIPVFPPPGGELIFSPGSTVKLEWKYDSDTVKAQFRAWFLSRSNSSSEKQFAVISGSDTPETNENILTGVIIKEPATLILTNVNQSFSGTYRFLLAATTGSGGAEVKVIIAEKPTVTIKCSSTTMVNKGDDIICQCKGEGGNPPANVTWYGKNGQIGRTGKEKQTLILRNVNGTYNGTYTCKAQSHTLTDNKSIEVRVRPDIKPTITSFITDPLKAVVGQPITIICVAIARPEPSYTIIHDGTIIVSTANTYTISRAEWNDTGTYTCNATNALGNDLEFLSLTVVGTHTNGHKKKRGLGVFAIVGIVVGVLALVVIIIGVIYWFIRCKEKNHEEEGNADAPLKKRRADANVYDAVATGGDDGEASTSTAPHEYATLEQVRSPHCADTQDL